MRVLVTAASRSGSTAEIAAAIGEVLRSRGLAVSVADPGHEHDLEQYDAVVLGSGLYAGHWLESASTLARRIGAVLPGRPVWLFSSGPVGDPSRKLVQKMKADPVELPEIMAVTGAREHRIFSGRLDRHELHGIQRFALWFFRSLEGDFREWDQIEEWAAAIAEQLGAPAA